MHGKSNTILCLSSLATIILIGEAKAACPAHTSCDPTPPTKGFIFVDVTDAPADPCSGVKAGDGGGGGHVAGAAAADFDRDGWVDVFVSWGFTALYHNQGDGTFTRLRNEEEVGIPETLAAITAGGLWFDYDNDGDLDLLIPVPDTEPPDPPVDIRLYRNDSTDGAISFIGIDNDVSGLFDAQLPHSSHGGICAGDINNDGWVDLLIARWNGDPPSVLYLNKDDLSGGRTFDDITDDAGLIVPAGNHFFQCVMADFNDDGWIDIYQACDGCADRLWINDQDNTFTERASDAGVPVGAHDMGVALGDYDNDGDLDIYVTNIGKEAGNGSGDSGCWAGGPGEQNWLLRNDECSPDPCVPALTDVAITMGVDKGYWGWGATFMDADNDAFLDIAATNGYEGEICDDPSRFFLNKGDNPLTGFDEVGGAVGFDDTYWGSALIAFDYDRDGDLDLMQRGMVGPLRLLRNDNCTGNNSLVIKPRRLSLNRLAIGAIVRVKPLNITPALPSGRDTLMRLISAGTSMLGQEPAEAFFGLGNATQVDITIEWPNVVKSSSIDTTDISSLDITSCPILTVYKGVNALADCNSNGRADGCDIGCGSGNMCGGVSGSGDCNLNGIPDACTSDCGLIGVCCENTCHECCEDSDCRGPIEPYCRLSDHTCICLTNADCGFGTCLNGTCCFGPGCGQNGPQPGP